MLKNHLIAVFPCKNCLIPISHKYRHKKLKLNNSEDTLMVFEGVKLIAKKPVKKMVPACRFCTGHYLHQINKAT